MTTPSPSLRDITGMGYEQPGLSNSALIMVDCQNTYRQGIMQLTNVEPAIKEAQKLLQLARDLKIPVIHIQHDAGVGTPYDVSAEIGVISKEVAPIKGENVIIKNYPNSFVSTPLEAQLKAIGIKNLVIAGFMTHMCINSTARGAFNLGFSPVVVASACASRNLTGANGKVIDAQTMHDSALAALRDLFAVIVDDVASLKS
ncbi:MAG: cysteine hydrolase family protein [Methylotenera sp.]|jgi:nicotinamidase-related amidase|nr:cysteine hydrolase family protein [Methylotenera sp.]HPH07592.1 cysteine hydrolase family protein [Methylotenera sp.]HPM48579.1 cysteine hydrolase family protein [Methylotenera sp.]